MSCAIQEVVDMDVEGAMTAAKDGRRKVEVAQCPFCQTELITICHGCRVLRCPDDARAKDTLQCILDTQSGKDSRLPERATEGEPVHEDDLYVYSCAKCAQLVGCLCPSCHRGVFPPAGESLPAPEAEASPDTEADMLPDETPEA